MAPSTTTTPNGTTSSNPKNAFLSNGASSSTPVQGPDSPLPPVSSLDSKAYSSQEALVADIVESMRLSGGCIVRNLVGQEALSEVEKEVRPWLDKAEPWNGGLWGFISLRAFFFLAAFGSHLLVINLFQYNLRTNSMLVSF